MTTHFINIFETRNYVESFSYDSLDEAIEAAAEGFKNMSYKYSIKINDANSTNREAFALNFEDDGSIDKWRKTCEEEEAGAREIENDFYSEK